MSKVKYAIKQERADGTVWFVACRGYRNEKRDRTLFALDEMCGLEFEEGDILVPVRMKPKKVRVRAEGRFVVFHPPPYGEKTFQCQSEAQANLLVSWILEAFS